MSDCLNKFDCHGPILNGEACKNGWFCKVQGVCLNQRISQMKDFVEEQLILACWHFSHISTEQGWAIWENVNTSKFEDS